MRITLTLLMIAFLFISCKEKSNAVMLLNKAQEVVENNPKQALSLLDSIKSPQDMDKENYMLYIVTLVQAKKTSNLSVKNNNQIFKAQEYFNNKGDYKNAAWANYYAAWVYIENNEYSKILESFLQSASDAEKSNNLLLLGRDFNNIGYFYFEQAIYDSAIVNYTKSLDFYNQIENGINEKLRTITNIGFAYDASAQFDSAIYYFDKCLTLARSVDNKDYEFYSLKNLGVSYYGKGLYDKSIEYLKKALTISDIKDELSIIQIELYLLNNINKQHNVKIAKQYVDFLETNIHKVTYIYTVKEIYAALSEYYSQIDNHSQALYYAMKEKQTNREIEANSRARDLLKINNDFYLSQQLKKSNELKSNLYLYISIIVIVILTLVIFVLSVLKENKKNKIKIQELLENYESLRSKIKL